MKKTLTKEAKCLLNEALYMRRNQKDVTSQQYKLLTSMIDAMGIGADTKIKWITD